MKYYVMFYDWIPDTSVIGTLRLQVWKPIDSLNHLRVLKIKRRIL